MIEIEGTSPPNDEDLNNKGKNDSLLPNISNQIDSILPSNSNNDFQSQEDSNLQQNTPTNISQSQSTKETTVDDTNNLNSINDNQNNLNFENTQKNNTINNIKQSNKEEDINEQVNTNSIDSKIINNDKAINNVNNENTNKEETEKNSKDIQEDNNENENNLDNPDQNNQDETENEIKINDTTNQKDLDIEENKQETFNSSENNTLDDPYNVNNEINEKKSFSNKNFTFFMPHADLKEVEDSLESLMLRKTRPPEQLHDPVMQLINRKKLDALIQRDYDLAEKYDQTAELLQKSGNDIVFERNERIRKSTIDDRSETISERINTVQQKYNKKIEDLKTERQTAIENLQSQHENENIAFRQKWQDPNFLSKYRHPSPALMQLRLTEKKLALSKFYDEAKEKKIWADKQQKIEEKQMQETIEKEMKKDFFRLKDAQYFQMKKICDHYESLMKSLELQKNKETQAMEYALKQMEIKKNTVPNRKLHTIPKELCQMNNKDTDTASAAKMSPRTLSRLAQFRNEKKGQINISPISETTFSKLIAAHPIVRPQSKFKINNHPPSRLRRL